MLDKKEVLVGVLDTLKIHNKNILLQDKINNEVLNRLDFLENKIDQVQNQNAFLVGRINEISKNINNQSNF
jgi:chaperonin cofactor prefoldin